MTSERSQIAGRYTVERAVGRGGTGTVWLCRDDLLGRRVAVKQVGNLPGESATDLDRALREARSAAGLHHPHVVSVFDAVEDGGRTWLVMEYVPSRTLAEVLAAEGPLDPRRAAHLGAQAAEGLAAAHAAGVIHRDVKPGNLLVTDDDRVKITDFGIAHVQGDPRLTQTGMVVGTPSYFAPEAARGEPSGAAGDVWSLGVSLYEAVEGRPPYADRGNALALLVVIAGEEAPPPQRAGVLTGPIAAMMRRDPEQRWTMAEAARELAAVARGDEAPAVTDPRRTAVLAVPPAPGPEPEVQPEPEPVPAVGPTLPPDDDTRRRRPWVVPLAAAVVLLLVLAGVGLALLTRDDSPATEATGDGSTATGGQRGRETTDPTTDPSTEPTTEPSSEEPPAPPPDTGTTEPEEDENEPDEEETDEGGGATTTDPASFAETYYGYLPTDTGSAYQLLSGDYQARTSQPDYEAFWNTIEAVDVVGVDVVDDTTVDVSLTYVTADGSQTETRRLFLAEAGGGLVIVDDEIV